MELVDGETLESRIHTGAVPLDEALAIAKQIADALDAAHEKGIVHRDRKPSNVKIKSDGTVKRGRTTPPFTVMLNWEAALRR